MFVSRQILGSGLLSLPGKKPTLSTNFSLIGDYLIYET